MTTFTERQVEYLKGRPEREAQRLLQWSETLQKEELQKLNLSRRILNDIERIPFPKIDVVKSSYLHGKTGSGKTIQAIFLTLADLRNGYVKNERGGTRTALFTSIPELLFEFKNTYSNPESETTENDLVKKYSTVDLLILDDFGVEKTTDWSFQLLYIIINRRYENMKKTIFTSNFSLTQLAEKLGDDRLPSRIQQMCETVLFRGKNYRTKL